MAQEQIYTFGTSDLARDRLALLARTYEPATRVLLEAAGIPAGCTVVDLGCGPGHSTRLLDEVLSPRELIGLDSARACLEEARQAGPKHARYVQHDVASFPLPVPPGSWLFCRFLLTHLRDAEAVLRGWRESVGSGGLILQETAELTSKVPALARYYEIVAAMQAHYGQALNIGRDMERLAAAAGWRIRLARRSLNHLPVSAMATLHVMNLRTWGSDPFVREHFGPELSDLEHALDAARTADGTVESILGELVLTYSGDS